MLKNSKGGVTLLGVIVIIFICAILTAVTVKYRDISSRNVVVRSDTPLD